MTIYFAGGEMTAFVPSDASTAELDDDRYFNPSFCRNGVYCGNGSTVGYGESATFSAPDEFYVHGEFSRRTLADNTATTLELVASGTAVFRIRSTDDSLQMQALISSVWQDVGPSVSYSGTHDVQTIDLYIDGNSATGSASLFLSGTLRAETGSINLSAVTGITTLRSYGINTASGTVISQVIVADEPTIGWRLASYYPSAAGAAGDWTGDYTSVDETLLNEADFIHSGTNGQVELFTGAGPALTGYVIRAVAVYARAKRGAGGPANLQLALRANGNNFFSSSKTLGVGYGAHGHIWETNPDTAADWHTSQISALQFGVKAIT